MDHCSSTSNLLEPTVEKDPFVPHDPYLELLKGRLSLHDSVDDPKSDPEDRMLQKWEAFCTAVAGVLKSAPPLADDLPLLVYCLVANEEGHLDEYFKNLLEGQNLYQKKHPYLYDTLDLDGLLDVLLERSNELKDILLKKVFQHPHVLRLQQSFQRALGSALVLSKDPSGEAGRVEEIIIPPIIELVKPPDQPKPDAIKSTSEKPPETSFSAEEKPLPNGRNPKRIAIERSSDDFKLLLKEADMDELQSRLKKNRLLHRLRELGQWPVKNDFQPSNGPQVYYPEKPFVIGSGDGARRAMVVYVTDKNTQELTPRLLYGSTTHVAIKYLPRIVVDGSGRICLFDKSLGEDCVSVGIHYQFELLERMYQEGTDLPSVDITQDADFLKEVVGTVVSNVDHMLGRNPHHTFAGQLIKNTGVEVSVDVVQKQIRQAGLFQPEAFHLPDANKQCDPRTQPEYLDLKLLDQKQITTPKYGIVDVYFFQSQHSVRPTRYMVCRAKKGGIWIATMETANPERDVMTDRLVPQHYLPASDEFFITPLLEKHENLAKLRENALDPKTAFFERYDCPFVGSDRLMTDYLKKLPVIQAFKRILG